MNSSKQFFSVHLNCRVLGIRFTHGVCYSLTESLRPVIEKMVAEGQATLYDEPVMIVTGQAYPTTKQRQTVTRTNPVTLQPSSAMKIVPGLSVSTRKPAEKPIKTVQESIDPELQRLFDSVVYPDPVSDMTEPVEFNEDLPKETEEPQEDDVATEPIVRSMKSSRKKRR